ncbi:MAG: hypothetical protein BMS9Abin02_1093 [Anaerolineae bacterium]|nr:MAG: hypothetical protein BMS9Abin02_1093 [Anaerolineae bacterium]
MAKIYMLRAVSRLTSIIFSLKISLIFGQGLRQILGRILTLLIAVLIISVTACQKNGVETPDSVTVPVILITATPSLAAEPLPTDNPPDTPTMTPLPSSTATPETDRRLPVNWRKNGDERFGLIVPAPRSWTDTTYFLRQSEAIERFGPLMLLLTDSVETAKRLMAGVPIDKGAYVFAYVGKSIPPAADPVDALSEVIVELGIDDSIIRDPAALDSIGIPAAYADVNKDPLDVFPLVEQTLIYRIVLYVPENGIPTIMVMATSPANWDTYLTTFSTLMELVELPQTRDRVLGHLAVGDTVEGNLIRGASDIWTFNGQEGQYATISLTPSSGRIDLTLSLFGPNGDLLVTVDDGYEGDSEVLTDIPLPADGTYIVEAKEFFNEIGRYNLNLLMSEEAQYGGGGPIAFGQEITSELVENGEHVWTFYGTASQDITIILSSLDEQLDVILELFGPDGSFLGLWDEGFAGDAEVANGFELLTTGEHSILVHGFAGHGGRYSLSLDKGAEDAANLYDAGDLSAGDVKREYLREDEVHAWFFNGQAGDDILIHVRPLGTNMDLEISLADETVTDYILTVDEYLSGESETIIYTIPDDAQYVTIIREFFGEPGEYEISLEFTTDKEYDLAGNITIGQIVEGMLAPGLPAAWSLEGIEGQIISIVLEPLNPDRDLVLELLDPSGDSAYFLDTSLTGLSERLEDFELSSSGLWTIVVREFFGEASDYRLSIFTLAE